MFFFKFLNFLHALSLSLRKFSISLEYICKYSFDVSECLVSSMSIAGFSLFRIGVLLVTGTVVAS